VIDSTFPVEHSPQKQREKQVVTLYVLFDEPAVISYPPSPLLLLLLLLQWS